MKRELKKMVLCLALTVATAVLTHTVYAGHGGGGGGGSSHSSMHSSASHISTPARNVTTPVHNQVLSSTHSNPVSNVLNHSGSIPLHTANKVSLTSTSHSLNHSTNHQHHNLPPHNNTHYCGKNPYWRFPIIWWMPYPNYCNSLTAVYYTPIYSANAVMVMEPITSVAPGIDLMLQAVGAVDAGNPAANLGPSYRVTIRNNSNIPAGMFNVMLLTGIDQTPKPDSPATVAKIEGIAAGQTMTFDVRLPVTALTMARDAAGQPIPFNTLFVAVDSNEQVPDVNRANNGAVLSRNDIPAVLP